jgi:hypothetical protein
VLVLLVLLQCQQYDQLVAKRMRVSTKHFQISRWQRSSHAGELTLRELPRSCHASGVYVAVAIACGAWWLKFQTGLAPTCMVMVYVGHAPPPPGMFHDQSRSSMLRLLGNMRIARHALGVSG